MTTVFVTLEGNQNSKKLETVSSIWIKQVPCLSAQFNP